MVTTTTTPTTEVTTVTEEEVITPAAPVITEEREDLEPQVGVTRAPGQPIITTRVAGTGQTCSNNPATALSSLAYWA